MQTWVFICGNDDLHGMALNSSGAINKVNFNGTLYFDSILTVTFSKQGGTGGTDSVTVKYDGTLTSGSAPTRSGYTFQGYYTSTNGGGTKYYDSDMYGLRSVDFKGDITLYAYGVSTTTTYYNAGTEYVAWSTGYLSTNGDVIENTSNVDIYCDTAKTADQAGWATTNTVNLTNISTLYITWSGTLAGTGSMTSYFCVGTSRTGMASGYTARSSVAGTFSSTTTSLDVSGLSGNYYIRVHCTRAASASFNTADTFVTKVWGIQ